ncbi:MAG: efflux transporter outer membrane subunit [Deltaproteobacteria bacterium]|nr:MAG: efflux transporter outer membrane subunit [Deltaproteobacteria bacterium]
MVQRRADSNAADPSSWNLWAALASLRRPAAPSQSPAAHSRPPAPYLVPALLAVIALLSACAVGPAYKRPAITAPETTRGQAGEAEKASMADQAWWEIFHDDVLQSLIDEALRSGYDLRLAAWRVQEARANAGIARSELFPEIQAHGDWSRSRGSRFVDPLSRPENLYDAGAGLSWEADLWGRIRRSRSYFGLRELDLRLDIAKRTAGSLRETHELFARRFEAGRASALETASAEASLASTSADIPDLERQIAAQENRLSLLLGRSPGPIPRGAALDEQALPPEVPAGLPSDLLERRPDILEAEQTLIAANAEVGVTVANFLPTISLTGAFGGVAPQVSELFGAGRTWSLGGGLLSPLFQGRRLRNQHRAALARWEQAKVRYEQRVTNAFSEAATALVAYQKLAEAERQRARSVAADRDAVRLSNERYRGGLSDYLEVLQAQQQQLTAENSLAGVRYDRIASMVQLYKALGGGWKLSDQEWLRRIALRKE